MSAICSQMDRKKNNDTNTYIHSQTHTIDIHTYIHTHRYTPQTHTHAYIDTSETHTHAYTLTQTHHRHTCTHTQTQLHTTDTHTDTGFSLAVLCSCVMVPRNFSELQFHYGLNKGIVLYAF